MKQHGTYSNSDLKQEINTINERVDSIEIKLEENGKDLSDLKACISDLKDVVINIQENVIDMSKHQKNGFSKEIASELIKLLNANVESQTSSLKEAIQSIKEMAAEETREEMAKNTQEQHTKRKFLDGVFKIILSLLEKGAIGWLIVDKLLKQ